MLTTQLQNQDPLNPTQSTEFSTQLATFSGVEQQVKTNEHLQALSDRLGVANISQLASWIGLEVRSSAPVEYDGTSVTLHTSMPSNADLGEVSIIDSSGRNYGGFTILPSQETIAFDGTLSTGETLPPGRYTFKLSALSGNEVIGAGSIEHYAKVVEASTNTQGGTTLKLSGGLTIDSTQALALRKP